MDPGVIGVFIPIVAIVMGIGIGMLSIWSEHKRKSQLLEQNHRERMHAIEKGIELPPLPPNLVGKRYYLPTSHGLEKRIAERMEEIRKARAARKEGA